MAWQPLVSCLVLLLFTEVVQLQDPCTTARLLPNLPERVIGYKLETTELPVSDYRLKQDWYLLPDGVTLATESKKCGTFINWWLKDSLPGTGESDLQICQNDGKSDCAVTKKITVRKCPIGYAYKLEPTDSDMEAYCIETDGNVGATPDNAPNISRLKPTISAGLHGADFDTTLEFYCDFTLPEGESYEKIKYDIEWNLHSGLSKSSSLSFVELVDYEDADDFRNKTKLTEKDLKDNKIDKPGFTLMCSVTGRKSNLGRVSPTNDSPPKFFGVKLLSPSVIRLYDADDASIELELTIPFGCAPSHTCTLDFEMLVPNTDNNGPCLLSNIAQKNPPAGRSCGVKFEGAGDKATFRIASTFGTSFAEPTSKVYNLAFSTASSIPTHRFFELYKLPSIRVEFLVNQTILQGKVCSSVSDPHITTFDGTRYDNQNKGTFIMYRHKELEVEVQTKTYLCNMNNIHSAPYCNYGVAVRAGRDIFLIDSDGAKMTQPPSFVSCNDGVLHRQIKKTQSSYEITLPHGTKVALSIDSGGRVNVQIRPSLVDVRKTEGLCELFDDKTESIPKETDPSFINYINKLRVRPNEDLFEQNKHKTWNVKPWSEELTFCNCSHTSHGQLLFNDTQCSSQRKCQVTGLSSSTPRSNVCDMKTNRKKRDVGGLLFDEYTDSTTAFHSNKRAPDTYTGQAERSKREAPYTDVTARADCLQMMNTSVFQKCDKIPNLDIDDMIENCVLDAVVTNTMDWTMSHLESIKQTCVEYVEVMQPLPPEVRAQLVVLPDVNSTGVTNDTYVYATLPPPTLPPSGEDPISAELLEDIKTNSCPNECQGHGKCDNGTCTCYEPFTSFDCSINITQPPVMLGIPDKGECDLQQRRCAETAVFGRNIAETKNLSCRLKHFVVDLNNTIQYKQSVDIAGSFESMFEVYCRFPEENRRKRSVPDNGASDGELAYGYDTSISNDGNSFSEGDTIIIYDSLCVNCTKVQDTILCIKQRGTCWREGRCYKPGEISDCYLCSGDDGDEAHWSTAPGCANNVPKPESMAAYKIGLIAASCAVVATVLIAVVVYIVKGKTASRRKVNDSMSSLRRK